MRSASAFAESGKVEPCKFAVYLPGRIIVAARGRLYVWETAQEDAWKTNMRDPIPMLTMPCDALEPRCIVAIQNPIGLILRLGAKSEVCSPIVEGIAIDMVDDLFRSRANNDAMHPLPAPTYPCASINASI